ncbi:unnamed protein product [Gordionus sp. m RMFG-2023]
MKKNDSDILPLSFVQNYKTSNLVSTEKMKRIKDSLPLSNHPQPINNFSLHKGLIATYSSLSIMICVLIVATVIMYFTRRTANGENNFCTGFNILGTNGNKGKAKNNNINNKESQRDWISSGIEWFRKNTSSKRTPSPEGEKEGNTIVPGKHFTRYGSTSSHCGSPLMSKKGRGSLRRSIVGDVYDLKTKKEESNKDKIAGKKILEKPRNTLRKFTRSFTLVEASPSSHHTNGSIPLGISNDHYASKKRSPILDSSTSSQPITSPPINDTFKTISLHKPKNTEKKETSSGYMKPAINIIGGMLLNIGYGIGGGGSYLHSFFPAYSKDVSENMEKENFMKLEAGDYNPKFKEKYHHPITKSHECQNSDIKKGGTAMLNKTPISTNYYPDDIKKRSLSLTNDHNIYKSGRTIPLKLSPKKKTIYSGVLSQHQLDDYDENNDIDKDVKENELKRHSSLLGAKHFLPKQLYQHIMTIHNPFKGMSDSILVKADKKKHSGSQEEILLNNSTPKKDSLGGNYSQPKSPPSKFSIPGNPLTNSNYQSTLAASHYNQSKFKEDSNRLAELNASGAGEEEEQGGLGTIHFGLSYDFQSQNLIVKILQAKALPAKDITGTSDPYARLFLLPDRKSKMETRVKKKCLNPIWNETFLYEGFPYHKLQNRILNLQVFDYDRFSKDDPIGEIFLPLNEVDLSQFPHYWKKLIPMDKSSKTGEILMTFVYLPGPGKLNIDVIRCKNLKATDMIGSSDPYITLWLLENGKKMVKCKTQTKFNTLNPVFQESFTFSVPTEKIRHVSVLVTAKDYDKFTRNDTIGSFLLSSRSSPMEMKHWKDMLLNPGKPVTQWHFFKKT